MARLQDCILDLSAPRVHQTRFDRDACIAHFGPAQGETCWRELAPKRLDEVVATALNARLATDWPAIRERIARVTLGAPRMLEVLRAAGAPTTAAELGWPMGLLDRALGNARMMRDRYTFLDFAGDLAR